MGTGKTVHPGLKRLAWSAVGAIFVVNLMGFLDTITDSALGCGQNWPLCSGQVIPAQWNLGRAVEFGHRGMVTLAVVLAVSTAVWALRSQRAGRQVTVFATVGLVFMGAQAGLGALAVVFVNPRWILAFHFGCSLLALVGFFLLAVTLQQPSVAFESDEGQRRQLRRLRQRVGILLGFTFIVVYYSAYVAFLGDGLACRGWPLCQSRWIPQSGAGAVDFVHRLAAVVLTVMIGSVWIEARKWRVHRLDLYRSASGILVLVLIQSLTGAYVALSHASVPSFMTHVACMMGLFSAECYLLWQISPERARYDRAGYESSVNRPIGG